MPDEDKNFVGALVLDFRKRWRHVKMIYNKSSHHAARINVSHNAFLNSRSEEKENIFFDVHTG